MGTPLRAVAALVAIALVAVGIWQLRSATMSTHVVMDPASQLAVTIDAERRQSEPGQSLLEMVAAKVAVCRLEVGAADPVESGRLRDEGRFRFVLQPSLDHTDRVQFRGCMEDWNVDHLIVDVVDMHDVRD